MAVRLRKARRVLTPSEWRRVGGFAGAVLLLHILGWGILAIFVAPAYAAIGLGTGFAAYTFGLRHAFDADHIAAIDNTTRKLMADGKRPLGVGFFFSLGHSTVVFALAVGLALAARFISGAVNDSSQLKNIGGYLGTSASAIFLYAIAALNLAILVGILRTFVEMRQGRYDEAGLEEQLQKRGLMNRILGRLNRSIRSSWQMYPLGILFGLGFDTATEVGLLALSAGAATTGLPWYAILCLPILFAAGMSLMDTADGAFMAQAYGWAFAKPVRKIYYNITVTGLSVAVAFLVGTVELLSIVAQYFNLSGGFWSVVSGLNLNSVGVAIVFLFVATWVVALAVWRLGRIEERWALAPAPAPPASVPPPQD
ncbi:MAG TPA: HoxN/HupN/NixA family nickel/cobalt transporter [Candidatus Sulfotelmatobacter sp.]|nr:HoxN/HupN/NixA family nickel/cobalt transporter [Candidatus Sulfotelmatobacter sp.]